MTRAELLEDLAFYKNLEKQIASTGKAYSIDSGGGSRHWTNHDLSEIRRILAELRNQYDNASMGSGLTIQAGW